MYPIACWHLYLDVQWHLTLKSWPLFQAHILAACPTSVNGNSVLPDAQAEALGVIPDTTPDPNHLHFTLNFKLCLEISKSWPPPPPNTTGSNTIIYLLDCCNDLLTDLSQNDPSAINQIMSHFCSKPSTKSPSFAAWNPKPSYSPQDPTPSDLVTLWPQHLLLLLLPLLSLFLSHASHTLTSGPLLFLFSLSGLLFPQLFTWLTILVRVFQKMRPNSMYIWLEKNLL